MSEKINNKSKAIRRYYTKRNFILVISLIAFVGSIIYMQIGSSVTDRFENSEPPVGEFEPPQSFAEFINQNSSESRGGFNISADFDQLPGFDIPANLVENLPDSFGKDSAYGEFPEIDPNNPENPIIDDEGFKLPGNIKPPGLDPNIDPGSPGGGLIGGDPGIGGGGDSLPFNPSTGSSDTSSNTTLSKRSDKARNLPRIDFIDLSALNFNFINISNLNLNLGTNFLIFLGVLAMPIIIINKIVPNFITKLDEFDSNQSNIDSIFVLPHKSITALKKKKERVKRLLIFKDHVEELIKRSKIRIERASPSHTIIIGYHELDKAFSEFSSLVRRKDITPLEHSKMHFETGEIDNKVLTRIVDIFYLSRFGHRELVKEDGNKFIENLDILVIDKSKISERLMEIERELDENIV